MFSIEQILAGICELFTGPNKLACSAIQLASSIHRTSMLHAIPAVECMSAIVDYHCPKVDISQICARKIFYRRRRIISQLLAEMT